MPKAVYFIRRLSKGNQNYAFSGLTHTHDYQKALKKVLKDFIAEKTYEYGLQRGEYLAIKNQTDKGAWGVFHLTPSGQVRFTNWT